MILVPYYDNLWLMWRISADESFNRNGVEILAGDGTQNVRWAEVSGYYKTPMLDAQLD